jgi:hypothetical protein
VKHTAAAPPLCVEVHGTPTLLRLGLEQAVTDAGLALAPTDVYADVRIIGTRRVTPSSPAVTLQLDVDLLTLTITASRASTLGPQLIALLAAALDLRT